MQDLTGVISGGGKTFGYTKGKRVDDPTEEQIDRFTRNRNDVEAAGAMRRQQDPGHMARVRGATADRIERTRGISDAQIADAQRAELQRDTLDLAAEMTDTMTMRGDEALSLSGGNQERADAMVAQSAVQSRQSSMEALRPQLLAGVGLSPTGQSAGLAPEKRATAIGELAALGIDPGQAGEMSDEQLLSSLTREKTRRQLDRENEQRELTQGTTMGKLEAFGYDPAQLEQMSPAERQRALTRMETQAALRPEETPEPVPIDVDGDGEPDFLRMGNTLRDMPRGERPTAKQRESQSLQDALQSGDFARAALLMGNIEVPGETIMSPNLRRKATVADARKYAEQLGLNVEQEASAAEQSSFTPVQESGIARVMEVNNLTRDEAINALREAGKL